MKKNFFKKLSFVLALAMIVSAIAPAAGVFAAASPALKSTKQYLYLSEKDGKTEYDFNIKNKVTGSKYAWTSSKPEVAEVDAKSGLTTAVGTGSTVITVKITTKAGKALKTLKADVIVKDNIATVDIKNAPEKALAVGDTVDLNRSFVTNSGSTTKTTAKTYWTVDKATTATIDSKGVFTATEAGEYKVTASVFQSKARFDAYKADSEKYAAYLLATDEVTITVAATMTVEQKDVDTIKLSFDSAMTDLAKNVKFYTLVGTTEVAVSTAKPATVSEDKKSATVDFYVPLTEGATYRVKYTGVETKEFVAATAKIEDVAKVVLKTTEAEVGKAVPVEAQLFNAAGVDITKTDLTNRVTFTTTAIKGVYLDSSAKTIMFFAKGEVADVEATFHTYKYEAGKEVGNVIGAGTIVGVDKPSTVVGSIKAWTIVGHDDAPNFSDVKQVLTVGEEKKLAVQLNTKTGTEDGTIDSTVPVNKITFTSSDNTILFVNNTNGYLYPVKAGQVTIVVKQDDKTVDAIVVTIGEARKASSITLGKTDLTLSNALAVRDTDSVSVKVKDQYGSDFETGTIEIKKLDGSPATLIGASGVDKVVFTGATSTDRAVKGTYYYEVKAQKLTAYVTVLVVEPTDAAPVYRLALEGTEVDNKSVKDAAQPTFKIDVFGYAGGAKVTHPAVSGGGYTIEVKDAENNVTTLDTTAYALTTVTGGSVLTAKKAGTYTVTLKNGSGVAIDIQYFNVKNTQTKPSFDVEKTVYTEGSLDTIARETFKVTFDGKNVTDVVTMGEHIGVVGTEIFVKKLNYTESIVDGGVTYTLVHTIDVNSLVVPKK